ncbi:MAG: Hpt domain-containing protein [Gammaproteobacteria bacterium]|nr:Hpt domain-containing protein [Gammaproteobacteria bacterium]
MNNKVTVTVDPDLEALIPGFLENRHKDVQAMTEALNTREFATIQSIGHSLKGVGGGYGFSRISDIGAGLESAAREQDSAAIQALIASLQDYLGNVEVVYQ